VFENPELKRDIFREFDRICQEHTIFATNTSSISLDEISSATSRADRCVGMHWWNPPYLMPLVEVVRGEKSSDKSIQVAKALALTAGKTPVVCRNSPGLLGVRIQAALVTETVRVLQEGLATPEEIDTAVRLTLGLRLPVIGPLRIVDLGGSDVFNEAYDYLARNLGTRFEPPQILRAMVSEGRLGVKTGQGFYRYNRKQAKSITKARDEWVAWRLKDATSGPDKT
jgi:3-hydroxybutyryl-CoA dehydrogenase